MPRRNIRVQVRVKRTVTVRVQRTVRPVVYNAQFIGQEPRSNLLNASACIECGDETVALNEQGLCEECAAG